MYFLLIKRGLYYRPDDIGYTGIRDHAGRYSEADARARLSPGITMVALAEAPEFSEACFDDLARNHLAKQRDDLRELLSEARSGYIAGSPPDEAWDARKNELLGLSKDGQGVDPK